MPEPTRPPAAPSEELQKGVQGALNSLRQGNREEALKEIQTMTLERLDALAFRVRQEQVPLTPEMQKALAEHANRLLQVQRIDQHLEALSTRLHLVTLLPELRQNPRVVFAQRTQETAKRAGEAAHGFLRTMRNLPGVGWLADGVRFLFGETASDLGRNILDGAQRLIYHLAAAPSFLGISPNTPFAGRLVEWGRDHLARLNAVRKIQEVVQAEGNPLITFDGRFSNAA